MDTPKRSYRIVREWSVADADYTYVCYETTHWRDNETTEKRFTGDREWAEKNAQHLGIEVKDQ